MTSKLTAKDDGPNKQFKPKIFKVKEENRQEISMVDVIMIREIIRIGIDQIVEIWEFNLVVDCNVDEIIRIDPSMNRIIEMTSEEVIMGVM